LNAASLISIITPAYQAKATLVRAAQSVLAQGDQAWEWIIIADDNEDYAAHLAAASIRDKRIKHVSTGKNASGPACARNVGLDHAQGELITCLDADDALFPHHLSHMRALTLSFGAAVCAIEMVEEGSGKILKNVSTPPADAPALKPADVLTSCIHACAPLMIDRRKIKHRYVETLPRMEDYVFLMQVFNAVEAMGYAPQPLYKYFKRPGSLTLLLPDDVAKTNALFIQTLQRITADVLSHQLIFKTDALRSVVLRDMDFYIAAEKLHVQLAEKDSRVPFQDALEILKKEAVAF
jgi:glycosyltransferase involved in cell wall biosynthesis